MSNALLLNGPNLNLLELREPEFYADISLKQLEQKLVSYAKAKNINLETKQSNHEGALIDLIHAAIIEKSYQAIIINAGGYTHTSIALLDALKIFKGKVIEVHLSDIAKREDFRKNSYISLRADKIFSGKGIQSYLDAINHLADSELSNFS
jgi:3-dehydroquinate dehydratase II